MSNTLTAVQQNIYNYLLNGWSPNRIYFDNINSDVSDFDPWARGSFEILNFTPASLSNYDYKKLYEYKCVLKLFLNFPAATGYMNKYNLLNDMILLINNMNKLQRDFIVRNININNIGVVGGWYKTTIYAEIQFTEVI